MILPRLTYILRTGLAVLAAGVLCVMPAAASAASIQPSSQRQQAYTAAAREFKVPEQLLLAIGYYQSRWEDHAGTRSSDGGYGPMNLRAAVPVTDGRGDPSRPVDTTKLVAPKGDATVDNAARLTGIPVAALKADPKQNIRGAAAILADRAKRLNDGTLPAQLSDWYPAAAAYLGNGGAADTDMALTELQTIMAQGESTVLDDGQRVTLPAVPGLTRPDIAQTDRRLESKGVPTAKKSTSGAECPATITCRFIPAGYAANSADPADYGSYDHANRPADMKLKYIVIHDTEGSYTSAIQHFQDTSAYVSAHYVIRSSDGAVTQMVKNSDVAWHAGDWYMNMHSIGIEHEGEAATGARWYTEAMYRSSANLVRYLGQKYGIPLDRNHIIGHDNIPGLTDASVVANHWDPGPYWDWNHYMELVQGAPVAAQTQAVAGGAAKNAVIIKPNMQKNVQSVNACAYVTAQTTCADQKAAANFVYLRTAPQPTAPLVSDRLLHSDGAPGTTKIDDWSAKAATGQRYGLAEVKGDWTAIWFSGKKAWFYSPASAPAAVKAQAQTLTVKPGTGSVRIYGGAYPEASVYPSGVTGPIQPKLAYTVLKGQQYVTTGLVPTDYFYDATIDYSKPHDHEVFKGKDRFYQIWYNQRMMFVKASDVVLN